DQELLALPALGLKHAVPGEDAQPPQRDPVPRHLPSPRSAGRRSPRRPVTCTPEAAARQASATRTASELAGTSCTRAHQAPAAAARAVTATLAPSEPLNRP